MLVADREDKPVAKQLAQASLRQAHITRLVVEVQDRWDYIVASVHKFLRRGFEEHTASQDPQKFDLAQITTLSLEASVLPWCANCQFAFAIQSDRLTARHRRKRIREIHNVRNKRNKMVIALMIKQT
mgnify:CR=1 FL=1